MGQTRYDWPFEPMDTISVDSELNTLLRLNPEFPLAVSHDIYQRIKTAWSTGTSKVQSK